MHGTNGEVKHAALTHTGRDHSSTFLSEAPAAVHHQAHSYAAHTSGVAAQVAASGWDAASAPGAGHRSPSPSAMASPVSTPPQSASPGRSPASALVRNLLASLTHVRVPEVSHMDESGNYGYADTDVGTGGVDRLWARASGGGARSSSALRTAQAKFRRAPRAPPATNPSIRANASGYDDGDGDDAESQTTLDSGWTLPSVFGDEE